MTHERESLMPFPFAANLGSPHTPPNQRIVIVTLGIVAGLTILNLLVNVVAQLRGLGFPYNDFLYRPDDNFADFFSLLASYPNGGGAAYPTDHGGLHSLIPVDPPSMQTLRAPGGAIVTHFHMTPLATLCAQAVLRLLPFIDPVALFFLLLAGLSAAWCRIAWRFGASTLQRGAWAALGLFAYPTLMMVVRGNLFAGLTMVLLVQAMLLGCRRRMPVAAALLLAIAVNLRPNAILFAVPLLLFHWRSRWPVLATLGIAGMAIFGVSLTTATALYPAYRWDTFLSGLHSYYFVYVMNNWGVAYGSSLFGALKLLVGFRKGLDGAATLVALAILGGGAIAYRMRRIDEAGLLFLTLSAYCLGSSVIADYHLGVFVMVPMALALHHGVLESDKARRMRSIALIASSVILAPKNYFLNGVSLQIAFNPMMLLAASLLVLSIASRKPTPNPSCLSNSPA